MTKARSNAVAAAAKGDLTVGTGTNLSGILPVSATNGDTIVADSSTSTGLRYQSPVNANPVLNSAMQVFQRGTTFTISGFMYTADRWQAYRSVAGYTVSRQVTNDTTNLPFIQYAIRGQRDSGNTSTAEIYLAQSFESVNSIFYAGKTVTLSFYARAGANWSPTSGNIRARLFTGTGTDQNVLSSGYTGSATPIDANVALTTTWQRFTYTAALATTTTEVGLYYNAVPVGTAGAADFFEITGVQVEVGSVATPFKTNGATIQGELAACQRYFYMNTSGVTDKIIAGGFAYDASTLLAPNTLPTTMRTTPTLIASTGTNFYKVQGGGYVNNFNTISLHGATTTNVVLQNGSGSSLATQGHGLMLLTNSASSSVALSAEL